MSFSLTHSGLRWLRASMPLLLFLACLFSIQTAQAATAKVNNVTAVYDVQPPPGQSNVSDNVGWRFSTTWDTSNTAIYCNFTTVLVAQYFDANGNKIDLGYNHFERTWGVPALTGTTQTQGADQVSAASLSPGRGQANSNPPSGTKSIQYFYRLTITVADGSNVYATDTNQSNINTITIP